MFRIIGSICLLMVLVVSASPAFGAELDPNVIVKPQTVCPVMGGAINKSLYVDHDGKRIYVCCQGCIIVVKKDPVKYIEQLETSGITLAETPPQLCPKCGEIKGTEKCCKEEGRTRCEKCGLLKGSPGCCKIPKGVEEPMDLCPKCGEIKGSGKCCKHEGRTNCEKCGMFKGSPGCCKMDAQGNPLKATDKFGKAQEKYEETEEQLNAEPEVKDKVQEAVDKAKN